MAKGIFANRRDEGYFSAEFELVRRNTTQGGPTLFFNDFIYF